MSAFIIFVVAVGEPIYEMIALLQGVRGPSEPLSRQQWHPDCLFPPRRISFVRWMCLGKRCTIECKQERYEVPYIIDGHNLIPRIPGMSLGALDDELELVQRLQAFYRKERKPVEVYFDRAPAGRQGSRKMGSVTVHFVREGLTADEAIRRRLQRLGGDARNWTLVSSDHQVQAEARAVHARVLTSEQFAQLLARSEPGAREGKPAADSDDVQHWLEEFERNQNRNPPDL